MSSLNKVVLADGRSVSIAEWYHQPVYSTLEFNSADSVNLDCFNYTPGQNVSHGATLAARTATEQDTNMVKKKAMNQDEALIVMAITYEAFALDTENDNSGNVVAPAPMLSGTDLRRLQYEGVFELYVGLQKKPQYDIPFAWLCQSIGTKTFAAPVGTTTVRIDYGTGGDLSAENQELLVLPIYIGGFGQHAKVGNSMYFRGRFFNAKGGAFTRLRQGVRLKFYLDGLKKRPA